MDTPSTPNRPLPASAAAPAAPRGGTVEPARRDTDNPGAAPRSGPSAAQYELRDPFAEVTFRNDRIEEVAAQAERLGATRFTALDAQGQRTPVHKVDGRWQHDTPDARAPSQTAASTGTRPDRGDRGDPAERTEDRGARRDATQTPATNASPTPRLAPDRPDPKPAMDLDTQDRAVQIARLESGLMERYLIKRATLTVNDVSVGTTEYRFRGDTSRVAFTETGFKLATDANSPSVARSMVDVAQARNWQTLRVSGSEEFRRLVWLEAGARGVKALGYEPSPADLERLQVERDQRQANRIEPLPGPAANLSTQPAAKTSARGNGGRKAVLVAIEAVLVDKKVPAKQREAIMHAAAEQLAQRARDGQTPRVKVYDKSAPSQHKMVPPTPAPAQQPQRSRERAAPVR